MQEINAQGGINGIQLKIAYLDDEYVPDLAKKNIETIIKDYHTNLFMACVGTPTLESYIDLVKENKIAILFPFTGATAFRHADYKNLLFYSPSYDRISVAVTQYILQQFTPKKWALLYQDDGFGIPPKNAVKKFLEGKNIKDILEVSFLRNDVKFIDQIKKIADFNPDAIGFFGPAISAQNFIISAGVKILLGKIMYGLSWLAGNMLQNFLHEKGLKMIIPNVVPNPKTSDKALVQKYREAVTKASAVIDVNALEGYMDVTLFAHLLKQIKPPITIEKIMHAAESLKNYDFEGLTLDFDPSTRVLSHEIWVDLGDGSEWIHMDLREKS